MSILIMKVDSESVVIVFNFNEVSPSRIRTALDALFSGTITDGLPLGLGHLESIALRLNRPIDSGEIERHSVVEFDHFEKTAPNRSRSRQCFGQKSSGLYVV